MHAGRNGWRLHVRGLAIPRRKGGLAEDLSAVLAGGDGGGGPTGGGLQLRNTSSTLCHVDAYRRRQEALVSSHIRCLVPPQAHVAGDPHYLHRPTLLLYRFKELVKV